MPDTDTESGCDKGPQTGHNAGTLSVSPQPLLLFWSSKHPTNLRHLNGAAVLCIVSVQVFLRGQGSANMTIVRGILLSRRCRNNRHFNDI